MEIEIQGLPRSIKPQYQARLRSVKTDISRCKKLSKDLHTQIARSDLLEGAPSSDEPYGPASDRTRLLAGVEVLSNSSRRLAESERIALETEEQGGDILVNLRAQREQIENTRDVVGTSTLTNLTICLVAAQSASQRR
jgi:vesicle transport through interaction with t-SNAREs protein 1